MLVALVGCSDEAAEPPVEATTTATAGTHGVGPRLRWLTPETELARVGERVVTIADLPAESRLEIQRLELEIFGELHAQARRIVDEALLELATPGAGETENPGARLEELVASRAKAPTDAELDAELAEPATAATLERAVAVARSNAPPGSPSGTQLARQARERVRTRVAARLVRERQEAVRTDLLADLRAEHGAELRFASPLLVREQVFATGFVRAASSRPDGGSLVQLVVDPAVEPARRVERSVRESLSGRVDAVLEVTYVPSRPDPAAHKYAEALQCAALQGHGWELHERLFDSSALPPIGRLMAVASEAGLDTSAFGECVSRGRERERVAEIRDAARAIGVDEPVVVFVDGRRLGLRQVELVAPLVERGIQQG